MVYEYATILVKRRPELGVEPGISGSKGEYANHYAKCALVKKGPTEVNGEFRVNIMFLIESLNGFS